MPTKFNLNRESVPDEEINSHKNFDELVKKFKAESITKARNDSRFLKNKKITYSAIIAGATVVCTVTYFSVFKNNPPKQHVNDKITTSQSNKNTGVGFDSAQPPLLSNRKVKFIAPPISKIKVPYSTYKVNAQKGGTIKHNQSTIKIPKNTFVNKKGEDIIGDVEIQYREFHNQADILASGIPMLYDSAGTKNVLESAGMFDIKGFQGNEPVYINPKKNIAIELASRNAENRFNQYVLDTVARNWVYMKKDVISNLPKIQESGINTQQVTLKETNKTSELQKQIDAIPPKIEAEKTITAKKINQLPKVIEPPKPLKQTEGKPQYELDVDYKEFPELEAYKNAVFEIGTENKNYTSSMGDVTWNSAKISEGTKKGKNYTLTLKQGSRIEKLIVYPVLVGKDYDNALASFEQKFTNYKNALAKREADEQKLQAEFEAKQKAYLEEQKKLNEELVRERIKIRKQQEQQLASQFDKIDNQQKVLRVFQVSNFGIYNSDCANSLLVGTDVLNPVYIINNSPVNPQSIHLVCYSKNMVIPITNQLRYNTQDNYSLCVVSGGKMYLCNKSEFTKTVLQGSNKFYLTELASNIESPADLRKALDI